MEWIALGVVLLVLWACAFAWVFWRDYGPLIRVLVDVALEEQRRERARRDVSA